MRPFESPAHFEAFLSTRIAQIEMGFTPTMAAIGRMVKRDAQSRIGTYQGATGPFPQWEQLAEWTQDDREEKGYNPNEPLLREGLLRSSIGSTAGPFTATIGVKSGIPTYDGRVTTGEVAMWQEFGATRLGQDWIPPRPFIGPAGYDKAPEAVEVMSMAVLSRLTGFPHAVFAGKFFTSATIYPAMAEAFSQGKSETGGR